MSVFFGTDGIRGKFNDELSCEIAYNLGNSLGSEINGGKILVGRDTRKSGDLLSLAFACGAMNAGANVVDVGVCPTAGISYLTNKMKFDFGVVVSASHNPAEFNGLKVIDQTGRKIDENFEAKLEKKFLKQTSVTFERVGSYCYKHGLVNKYIDFLKCLFDISLPSKKIVVDCSNGAACVVAKKVFKNIGAKVTFISASPNGTNINESCGALHIKRLQREVLRSNADVGFAYDGDSDRLIAVDEKGKMISGDELIYIFANFFKLKGELFGNTVVGTRHTNMGVEEALLSKGIELIRTEIGDKYVSSKLIEKNLMLGGEQSGHIIIRNFLGTGDGILNSLLVCKILSETKKSISDLNDMKLYYQENINVEVKDKLQVINSQKLSETTEACEKKLGVKGRIMIRISGTEPYIRIMAESEDENICRQVAKEIAETVRQIDKEN